MAKVHIVCHSGSLVVGRASTASAPCNSHLLQYGFNLLLNRLHSLHFPIRPHCILIDNDKGSTHYSIGSSHCSLGITNYREGTTCYNIARTSGCTHHSIGSISAQWAPAITTLTAVCDPTNTVRPPSTAVNLHTLQNRLHFSIGITQYNIGSTPCSICYINYSIGSTHTLQYRRHSLQSRHHTLQYRLYSLQYMTK